MQLRKATLRAQLVAIAAGVLLGCYAIVSGGISDLGFKAVISCAVLAVASALAFAALSAWTLPSARLVSRACLATTLVATAMLIAGIWIEVEAQRFWRIALTMTTIATASAHGAALLLARVPPRQQWVRPIALALDGFLAAAVCAVIWNASMWDDGSGETLFKLIGVLALLDLACSAALAAFHHADRIAPPPGGVAEVCFCPRCSRRLWVPAGELRCHHCNACFYIELRAAAEMPAARTAR